FVTPDTIAQNQFAGYLPTTYSIARAGGSGAIASDPLGHTLDYTSVDVPYIAFHIYYEASSPADFSNPGYRDIDHLLVFGYLIVKPAVTIIGAPAGSPEGTQINVSNTVTELGGAHSYSYAWSVTKNGGAFGV